MRTRTLVVIAVMTLPAALTAQVLRLPRGGRGTAPPPAALPPEAAPVARALAYKRSRWSAEGYSFMNAIQVPSPGGVTHYTTAGTGTRAAYRYTEQWSATLDMTTSLFGDPITAQTAEAGTRFSPLPWDRTLRPFFDVRAAYMRLYDTFASPTDPSVPGGLNQQYLGEGRYSRGFGGVGGAGLEFSLTRSLALSTEMTATRNHLTVYRLTGPATIPSGNAYWLTSFRYVLGLKFNPGALHLKQNPAS